MNTLLLYNMKKRLEAVSNRLEINYAFYTDNSGEISVNLYIYKDGNIDNISRFTKKIEVEGNPELSSKKMEEWLSKVERELYEEAKELA